MPSTYCARMQLTSDLLAIAKFLLSRDVAIVRNTVAYDSFVRVLY